MTPLFFHSIDSPSASFDLEYYITHMQRPFDSKYSRVDKPRWEKAVDHIKQKVCMTGATIRPRVTFKTNRYKISLLYHTQLDISLSIYACISHLSAVIYLQVLFKTIRQRIGKFSKFFDLPRDLETWRWYHFCGTYKRFVTCIGRRHANLVLHWPLANTYFWLCIGYRNHTFGCCCYHHMIFH